MSIGNVSNVGPATSVQNNSVGYAPSRAAESAVRDASVASASVEPEVDPATQQPKPLRFPWLSRLATQLEATAKQKPAFPAAPVLGDNLDRTA